MAGKAPGDQRQPAAQAAPDPPASKSTMTEISTTEGLDAETTNADTGSAPNQKTASLGSFF